MLPHTFHVFHLNIHDLKIYLYCKVRTDVSIFESFDDLTIWLQIRLSPIIIRISLIAFVKQKITITEWFKKLKAN